MVGGVSQHYYNTTTLSGRELRQYETAAAGQESDVLALFQTYPDRDFSPDDVHQRVLQDAPITSVRRAMTNLTTRGLLVKTERKTLGRYGRPAHLWRLARADRVKQWGLF